MQIATKLNRSHLLVGKQSYLLPCLVRSEEDRQATGPQTVTMEDSLSCIHGSVGKRSPASDTLLSELAIVAGIAKATLPSKSRIDWDLWTDDYATVRALIAETYPDDFHDFEERMVTPGGFHRRNAARERDWKTPAGRARFTRPTSMSALGQAPEEGGFTLITLRSNDQFNTTVYGLSDRLRGLEGNRDIVLMSPLEIERTGLVEGQRVTLESTVEDGTKRQVRNLAITAYDLPKGCVGAYYPETNALVPLGYHDMLSKTPAYKGAPVRVLV